MAPVAHNFEESCLHVSCIQSKLPFFFSQAECFCRGKTWEIQQLFGLWKKTPSVHQLGSFNSWLQPLSWLALHRYLQLSACNTSVFIVVTPTFILFQAFQSVPGSCCKPGKIHHTVVGLPTVLYLVGTQSVLSYSLLTMFPSIKFWEFEVVHFSPMFLPWSKRGTWIKPWAQDRPQMHHCRFFVNFWYSNKASR